MNIVERARAAGIEVLKKANKGARVLRKEGPRGLAQRTARVAYKKLGAASLEEPLRDADIADSTSLSLPLPSRRPAPGTPLHIGWVTTPPAAGSGGHTTLLRMVEAVEQAGHRCTLFLYDRYGGDPARQETVIREWWPKVKAQITDANDGISGVDACVASSWETAHVLATHGATPMRRLYFIQDFEPYFYPRGSLYSLAEDTYRFGFRCVALGEMVARLLRSEIGIAPDVTEFGCDTSVYHPLGNQKRTGVVLYARPDVPRRGYWLARLALERFHQMHPEAPIHIYGERVADLSFPVTQHGRLTPTQLNGLYNTCRAGLAMSFTNISLVAEEMLAAGVSTVVNDSVHSRADLENPNVFWAPPTPAAIAEVLSDAYSRPTGDEEATAASVRQFGWTKAQADVVRIIQEETYRA